MECLRLKIGPLWMILLVAGGLSFGALPAAAAEPNFTSALYNVLSYARQELGHDFGRDGCEGCEVRVTQPQTIERYVDLRATGFEGETLQEIERVIQQNEGRALVVTNLRDRRSGYRFATVVFLPTPEGSFPGFDDSNGVLLANTGAAGCGLRSFGQKGTQHWCASCAVGFCCGTCKCTSCGGDLTAALQELDLPEPLERLFDGPVEFEAYPLDTDLVH